MKARYSILLSLIFLLPLFGLSQKTIHSYDLKKRSAMGHPATLWIHEGRPHAFMDSGKNEFLGIEFEKDAVPALERILVFLDSVFYSK